MAYTIVNGDDTAGSDAPWFLRTLVTCPRCGWQGRLGYEEFATSVGPHGATQTLWHGWRQVVEGVPAQTQVLDSAHLWIDPAQVVGPCPWCFYNPIAVQGPNYGLTKLAAIAVDPTVSLIQSYIAGGAGGVIFFRSDEDGLPVAVFVLASGIPYGLDATGSYANAVRRATSRTLDAATKYLLQRPGRRITAAQATELDVSLTALLARLGLALL